MPNAIVHYTDKLEKLTYSINDVPVIYEKLVAIVKKCGFNIENPDIIISAMFNSEALAEMKKAEFEAYADAIHMPNELRPEVLRKMLLSVPEDQRELFKEVRREFNSLGLNLTPEDIRYHYRKYQLTEAKKNELIASTTYELTDEEQADCDAMFDVIVKLRKLRHHNNINALLRIFVADSMNYENDRSLSELPRAIHEHRCMSKEEVLQRKAEREAEDRRINEEITREIEEGEARERAEYLQRLKAGEIRPNADRQYVQAVLNVKAHHAASRGRIMYGSVEASTQDEERI